MSLSRPPTDSLAVAPSAENFRSRRGLGIVLIISALAFVLASSPVRQPEVWSHLARGRALMEGRPLPERDPQLLSPTSEQHAYSSILYDLLLDFEFRAWGGPGVAIPNAVLAALLAGALFLAARTASNSTLAGGCTILALLCIVPSFGLTPRLFSSVFLALLVLLLRKSIEPSRSDQERRRMRWLVPVLIAVWANVDRWVVLGPLAIGLLALAEWRRGRSRIAKDLSELFLTGLIASLLSPNVLTVWNPTHIVSWKSLDSTPSPFWPVGYRFGAVLVSLAYAILVLLGLLAFRKDTEGRARVWLPLWMALLGLAVVRPAVAPFFAVIAAPVAARILSGVHWPTAPTQPNKRRRIQKLMRRGVRLVPPMTALALLAVAWPGWIAGPPYGRPSWSVEVDDSLRDAVRDVAKWRADGRLGPNERGLTLSPEVADYWSRFGSEARDASNFNGASLDFAIVRAGLLGEAEDQTRSGGDWREALRARGVNHVILHSGGVEPTEQIVMRLARSPDEWTLLYLRGRTAVFGWRDPSAPAAENRLAPTPLRLEQRAFLFGANLRAPLDGPGVRSEERAWLRPFLEPPPPPPLDQAEAALYLAYFDGHRDLYNTRYRRTWLASQYGFYLGNLASPLLGWGSLTASSGQWAIGVPEDWTTFLTTQDDGPLGVLLLAVRAARSALQANPDDPKSYFLLGEAYLRLAQATQERSWRHQLPIFDRIRQMQAITAYHRVLALRPDSHAAHGRLARLYRDLGSFDLALRHLNGLIEATRVRGPQPGEEPERARESLVALERDRDDLTAEVRRREAICETGKGVGRALNLAREAIELGLPDRALTILLKSDASEFGSEGVRLELELLLWAGRANDVRAWLDPALETSMGTATYREILVCLAAVTGNYREADTAMRGVTQALVNVPSRLPNPYAQASYDISRAMVAIPFVCASPGMLMHSILVREGLVAEVEQITASLRREANAIVVSGLLALESGEIEEAESLFHKALSRWKPGGRGSMAGWIDFSGRRVAEAGLRLIAGSRIAE